MDPLSFEYWSDPLCIWAFVAQPKLEHLLERFGDRIAPQYHVVPLFGSIPKRFEEGSWSDGGPERRAEVTRRIARDHGFDEVTGECWLSDCPASSWPAGVAITAVFAMEAAGECEPGSGAAYQLAMRAAFFVENQNVARRDQQLLLAEACGIPRGPFEQRLDDGSALCALYEEHEARQESGVRGSPTYRFDGGRASLYGNFSEAVLTATVEELTRGRGAGGTAC